MNIIASQSVPAAISHAYSIPDDAKITRVASGLINSTWLVESVNQKLILQRLNSIFSHDLTRRVDDLTRYLASRGVTTTAVLKTTAGDLQVLYEDQCWRALTYISGTSLQVVSEPHQAYSAAKLLATFHELMSDYPQSDLLPIASVHDISKHERTLREALKTHRAHKNITVIEPVALEILTAIRQLPALPKFPEINIHGDPKISNFIFDKNEQAKCLIDLDTVGRGQLLHELGDALRSWCNPKGEDSADTVFDINIFQAGVNSYVEHCGANIDKLQLIYAGLATQTIYLELAARFCADALNESYFRWDPEKFASASEHHLIRAMGQLKAAKELKAQSAEIYDFIDDLALE